MKILKSESFFVTIATIIGMLASLWPMIYELIHKNNIFPDRQFVLVYNFAPDYNAYLSKIIQGIQGKWLVSEYFTSEPHAPSLLQIFYLWVGRLGGLISQNPDFSYHAARIIFGLGWILAGWFFIKYSFESKLYRKLAFLLFVFGGNFPHLLPGNAGYGFPFLGKLWDQTMVGWSNLDPVRRMTFIPHWNAGHVATVLSLLFFIKFLTNWSNKTNKSNWTYFILSVLFGILAGLILPPTLIIVYAILGLWIFWKMIVSLRSSIKSGVAISNRLLHFVRNDIFAVIIYFLLTFPVLIYNVYVTQTYPWKSLVETDLFVNKIVFPYWNYMVALGPVGFLGLFGVILVLVLKKEKLYWSSFWVLGMFVLIIVFDKVIVWHDQTRFLEVGPELPLSILSVVTLSLIKKLMVPAVLAMMLIAVFLFTVSITAQVDFINHKMLGSYPPLSLGNYVVYPVKTLMAGVDYIKNNAKDHEVTLSGPTTGNHIGAYAGKFVYIGHGSQTVHYYEEKQPKSIEFYQGRMDNPQKFLKDNDIKFVFYGPEEQGFGDFPTHTTFLKEVFRNKDVIIYKTKF